MTPQTGYAPFFPAIESKSGANAANSARSPKMDPRSQERPQGDLNQSGTSQEDPDKIQERGKKKRNCRFSAEEQEILVKEVTKHQHQLFVTSKLPLGRREAIWQQIVDKINSVAEIRRTVTECKGCWHDCKRRTKEKMARNRKAALQTRGGSPAPQEALDQMEEMVAAVIPEEIVTGIQGQDRADYQETKQMQDRRGQGRREHRRQAGGAPQGILTAAVRPRSEEANRRSPAGLPLPLESPMAAQLAAPPWGILTPPTAILFLAVRPSGTGWR
ncbi:hypothetical protein NDU88_002500 [Pleurodeles waltl]|uniref:Myb/SANT-like DNA-binding domain-containing protein n=1 Tax=Pleurodeles waltl TaxID=8319 RepID=A0AAV7T3T0_PLEWA|nr:hypothetical protein NDU88_002500 [Pleurodeles waltl]